METINNLNKEIIHQIKVSNHEEDLIFLVNFEILLLLIINIKIMMGIEEEMSNIVSTMKSQKDSSRRIVIADLNKISTAETINTTLHSIMIIETFNLVKDKIFKEIKDLTTIKTKTGNKIDNLSKIDMNKDHLHPLLLNLIKISEIEIKKKEEKNNIIQIDKKEEEGNITLKVGDDSEVGLEEEEDSLVGNPNRSLFKKKYKCSLTTQWICKKMSQKNKAKVNLKVSLKVSLKGNLNLTPRAKASTSNQ